MKVFLFLLIILMLLTIVPVISAREVAGEESAVESRSETALEAEENESTASDWNPWGLEISGFVDVIGNFRKSLDDESDFGIGQAEIDLEGDVSDRVSIALAVAYNNEEALFELGAAEIGINLFASEEGLLNSIDITSGQFDVPFGIDYNCYPSVDRKLITAPEVVESTHGCWNDAGVRLNMDGPYANFVFYAVNGFESSYEVIDAAHSLELGVEIGEEVDTSPAYALGTRLGISPFQNLEIGTSVAVGFNKSEKDEMALYGADLKFSNRGLELKGEYIVHSLNRSIEESENKGYYFQGLYNFNRFFVTSRYGSFKPDGAEWTRNVSVGGGYAIDDLIELRLESNFSKDSDENTSLVQLVAGF